jgi:hypothetical protein
MKSIILLLLILTLTSCASSQTKAKETSSVNSLPETKVEEIKVTPPTAQQVKNCICVKIWMPVCGENNRTYGNSCEANCAKVKFTQGACETKK